ncbi:MAG: ECF transporter S component [Clostridia bacterium]|nr:ECF transporter S component [Clostridia bacterium]
MKSQAKKKADIEKLVLGGILTALVVVLQYMGSFIKFGPFSISLVLIPIVIGAATCSTKISTWLGFVFSVVVLALDASAFFAISVPGTIITVLAKGTACGLTAGLVYKLLHKKNEYAAVIASAIVCPITNTGIFLLGCVVFFFKTIQEWGVGAGYANAIEYMFLGLAGGNFLFEMATNIVLCPVIIRILNIRKKNK